MSMTTIPEVRFRTIDGVRIRYADSGRVIVNTAVDTIAGGIPDDIRADYLDCYADDRFVTGQHTRTAHGMI